MIVLGYEVPPELLERLEARMRKTKRFQNSEITMLAATLLEEKIGQIEAWKRDIALADRVLQHYRRRGLIVYERPWWRWVGGAS